MGTLNLVGNLAAFCTTIAYVPQIVKIWRQGGEDLSYPMLLFYLAGILLWLAYGLIVHSTPIIWANVATAILVAVAVVLKATVKVRASQSQGESA